MEPDRRLQAHDLVRIGGDCIETSRRGDGHRADQTARLPGPHECRLRSWSIGGSPSSMTIATRPAGSMGARPGCIAPGAGAAAPTAPPVRARGRLHRRRLARMGGKIDRPLSSIAPTANSGLKGARSFLTSTTSSCRPMRGNDLSHRLRSARYREHQRVARGIAPTPG